MVKRKAYIIKSSNKRHVCIDAVNEEAIMKFLSEDPARMKKFKYAIDIILQGLRVTELYDKEEINANCKDVTAIKMFKHGQNVRLYCKEQNTGEGIFFVIVAELLPKKKDEKVKGKSKSLIQKVATYEYEITKRGS